MEKFWSRSNIIFFSLVGVLIFVILYPKFPLINIYGTYVAVRVEDLLIAILLLAWFILNLKSLPRLLKQPVTQVILLFWFIGFLSVVSGILVTFSVTPSLGFLHWLRRIEVMSLFFVAATSLKSKQQLKIVLISFALVSAIVVLYGLGQVFLQFPVVSTNNKEFSKGLILKLTSGARPNSTFAGHYDLAVFLSIVLIFMTSLFFFIRKIWVKASMFIVGLLSLFLLGLTAARISFAATVFGIGGIFWLSGKKMFIIALLAVTILTVLTIPQLRNRLLATITINVLHNTGPTYQPKASAPLVDRRQITSEAELLDVIKKEATLSASKSGVPVDIVPGEPTNYNELDVARSLNIRTEVEWPRAIAAFEKNPALGTGYSSLTIATDNDILRSFGETGVLGTVFLGAVFLVILREFLGYLKKLKTLKIESSKLENVYIISAVSVVGAVFITGLFIDVLEASKIAILFWIMLGFGWAIVRDYRD